METNEVTAVVEVPAHGAEAASFEGAIEPKLPLMVLTWFTFALICFVLYKVAWKPILGALQSREDSIRKALADAEKARIELAEVESRGRQVLGEAQAQSESMIRAARAAAAETASAVQAKAREEAANIVATARREIETATDLARRQLRAESANLAAELAAKMIAREMTPEKNRELVERMARDV